MRWDSRPVPDDPAAEPTRLKAVVLGQGPLESKAVDAARRANFEISEASNLEQLLHLVTRHRPDALIIGTNRLSGSSIGALEDVRSAKVTETLPIILCSDDRMTLGKDMPGMVSEILTDQDSEEVARLLIRAALRRTRPQSVQEKQVFGVVSFDPASFTVSIRQNSASLRKIDHCLLGAMLDDPGRQWDRMLLTRVLFEPARRKDDRTIDVYVSRIRRLLRTETGIDPILSVRGVGYALDSELADPAA